MVDTQAVIKALISANESQKPEIEQAPPPTVTISRDFGSGGDEIAEMVAEKLGVRIYNKEILDDIARQKNAHNALMSKLHETVNTASDAWLYAMVFGKNVTRDDYQKALVTAIRAIYRSGGVIMGRGAHVILEGRKILRVRITGSVDACAKRVAQREGVDLSEAKKKVRERRSVRGKYLWSIFSSRINDPTKFDLTINTDQFTNYAQAADLIVRALEVIGIIPETEEEEEPAKKDKAAK